MDLLHEETVRSNACENQTQNNASCCLPMELTNATGTYLDHLNEDCLLEIFSYLDPMEWCSLAETCKRFKQITQRLFIDGIGFKPDYKSYEFKYMSGSSIFRKMVTLQYVERIFKNFGQCLSSLELHKDLDLLKLVTKYCDDVALKRFLIYKIEGISLPLNQMLQRRLKLSVDSLIELRIDATVDPDVVLKHTFPNLERLMFTGNYLEVDSNFANILFDFISRHEHLKTIDIRELCNGSFYSFLPLHVIESSCKELEELTLDCLMSPDVPPIAPNVECFAKLKKLELGFQCHCHFTNHILPFLLEHGLKLLETMKISSMFVDEKTIKMFEVVPQLLSLCELNLDDCGGMLNYIPWAMFPQLRRLHLLTYSYDIDYVNVVRQLTNLEELEFGEHRIGDCFPEILLKEQDFFDIVQIVQQRDHMLRITCRFDFNYPEIFDQNQKVRLIQLKYHEW